MPVENERKYLLSLTPDHINELVHNYGGIQQRIRQAYVGEARIRGVQVRGGLCTEQYFFTWKKRRTDGSRMEIEMEISNEDFKELWEMADKVITKERIKIQGYGVSWDIDFLFSGHEFTQDRDFLTDGDDIVDSHYLTIAEVEMPEGMDEPDAIPRFIRNHMLYLVPRYKDDLWVNTKLTDPKKVKKMLKNALKEEKKDRGKT